MSKYNPGKLQMAVLRQAGIMEPVTVAELATALDMPCKSVSKAASLLIARGYLSRRRVGLFDCTLAGREAIDSGRVITSGPLDAAANVLVRKATNGFRDRLWRSMRMRDGRSFTIHDLVCDAIDQETDAINDASRYIRILRAAGFVRELPGRAPGTRPGSNGFKRFGLVKNTGPRAPLHRSKLGIVHDFNTGEDVPCVPR